MARITHVAHARQRYETVPVLDAEGNVVTTPVLRSDGRAKTTKKGKEVVRSQSTPDKTKPLPNETCGKCHKEIKVGDPYKWIAPKSGPYGGRRLVRCESCPSWHVWEYSSSLSARLAQVAYNFETSFDLGTVESAEDVTEALSEVAEAIHEIASEKEESAENIESGFGHETSSSQELREVAESLNSWADEIENIDIPDYPEPEEGECDECGGDGTIEGEDPGDPELTATLECEACEGKGTRTPDEPTEEQLDTWRSEVEDAISIVNDCPV